MVVHRPSLKSAQEDYNKYYSDSENLFPTVLEECVEIEDKPGKPDEVADWYVERLLQN